MTIYFAGAGMDEEFNPEIHNREDLAVFSLSIVQKENEVAVAEVKVRQDEEKVKIFKRFQKFFISWEKNEETSLIFAGIYRGMDLRSEADFCVFNLYAAPTDIEEKIANLLEHQKVYPYWDPLFVPLEKRGKSTERQDTQTDNVYVDKKSWDVRMSGYADWYKYINIKGNFIRDSLVSKKVREPLRAVTIRVRAEWIQDGSGVVNIAPAIARKFPGFQINSFSSIAIEANWPKSGQKLGRSGYEVIQSRFEKCAEKSSFSPPLSSSGGRYYARRNWYKSALYLRWRYRQKRSETIEFSLRQGVGEKIKTLNFLLEDINPDPNVRHWAPRTFYPAGSQVLVGLSTFVAKEDHRSVLVFEEDQAFWMLDAVSELTGDMRAKETFFLTPRGKRAFNHALTIAQYHLQKSRRTHEISVTGRWEDLIHITTDNTVTLEDSRFPEGSKTGKVVFYKITADGKTGVREVTITISPTIGCNGENLTQELYASDYACDGYVEKDYLSQVAQLCTSASGLAYYSYQNQVPPSGIQERCLQSLRMVKRVQVKNGPTEQWEALLGSNGNFREVLKNNPTQVQVELYDLRTRPCLSHTIQVDCPTLQ